jgi:hypothetical protein
MEVVISRPKQSADILRVYNLMIDGEIVAQLKAGEEVRVTLPENAKTLSATIDWCASNELLVSGLSDGERLEVKNAISTKIWIPFFPLYAVIFKRKSYLSLHRAA